MLREDFLLLLPAVLIALIQLKFIWKRLPHPKDVGVETSGEYDEWDKFRLYYLQNLSYLVFIIQLAIPILPISSDVQVLLLLRIAGYLLILAGFLVSLLSLWYLGTNWSGMGDYQIKTGQRLVTHGVYRYIRHPIYLSALIESVGFELVVGSWLCLPFLIVGLHIFHHHIVKEERLLVNKFGVRYQEYRSRSWKLIPFIY